jgi:hypothetical protein
MKPRLNNWQTILLFAPYILGCAFLEVSHVFKISHAGFIIANIFIVFNLFLVLAYHACLFIQFNKQQTQSPIIYSINALIPVIAIGAYFINVLYSSTRYSGSVQWGPMPVARFNFFAWFVLFFLMYAGVNYFFINNLLVKKRIATINDENEKTIMVLKYFDPMKRMVRISLWIIVICLLSSVVFDIIIFFR